MKTSTERSQKHAENHPESARDRKRKQRDGEVSRNVLFFYAKHWVKDLSRMADFENAYYHDMKDAIINARADLNVGFCKV